MYILFYNCNINKLSLEFHKSGDWTAKHSAHYLHKFLGFTVVNVYRGFSHIYSFINAFFYFFFKKKTQSFHWFFQTRRYLLPANQTRYSHVLRIKIIFCKHKKKLKKIIIISGRRTEPIRKVLYFSQLSKQIKIKCFFYTLKMLHFALRLRF